MTRHPQREVTNPYGTPIEVDEGLADFLLAFWGQGFITWYSCEEDASGGPYIMFPNSFYAEEFIKQYGGELHPAMFARGGRLVKDFTIPETSNLSKTAPRQESAL